MVPVIPNVLNAPQTHCNAPQSVLRANADADLAQRPSRFKAPQQPKRPRGRPRGTPRAHARSRPVWVYDTLGEEVGHWLTMADAIRALNAHPERPYQVARRWAGTGRNRTTQTDGYVYVYDPADLNNRPWPRPRAGDWRAIRATNPHTGAIVAEYATAADAVRQGYLAACLSQCLAGNQRLHRGLQWAYVNQSS